jgi:hypothetical protein
MVQVLLNDAETYDLLYDFAERYVKAMHPLDIAEYGLKAASVIITIIASIAAMIYSGGTSGAGTAGKLLINIKRLREASPVVDKIYRALKCTAYRTKLPKLIEKGVSKVKRRRTKTKGKGGVPEVKAPDKIDKNRKKGYSGDDDGPKKTDRDDNVKKKTRSTKEHIDNLKRQGHGPQRHEGQLTETQLDERVRKKHDPETGSREDKYRKNSDGTPANHRCGDHATKVNSEESYVKAESHSRNSDVFREKAANGEPSIKVETPLEEIYGPNYKTHVSGRTRTTPWPDTSTPTIPTDFTDGKMIAIYRQADNSSYNLVTMYPNPR